MTTAGNRHWRDLALFPLEVGAAAVEGWSGYLTGLCRRRANPFDIADDVLSFWMAVSSRECPKWAHHSDVARRGRLADCRNYSADGPTDQIPTLVIPPHSGRASSIVDYADGRSLMYTLREAGIDNLYCLDWHGRTPDNTNASIDDYLDLLTETTEFLGGRINLVGFSQGGWLATIFAALHPAAAHSLVTAGAPIDFHAGRPHVVEVMGSWLRDPSAAWLRTCAVAIAGLQYRLGEAAGVPLGRPAAEFEHAMTLLAHIDEPESVERYIERRRWFAWSQQLPDRFRDWMIEELFVTNRLISNELRVKEGIVTLESISCPVFLIAGSDDEFTPPEQVWALERHISTPPEHITRRLVNGGHLSLIIDPAVLEEVWRPVMRSVAALSATSEGDHSPSP